MELTSRNVEDCLMRCLFTREEIAAANDKPENVVEAHGVRAKFGFHAGRIEQERENISDMLGQLPENFNLSTKGGWSFLQACQREDGVQWGEHQSIDNLLCLGIAVGLAGFLFPREMWQALPGGLPYFWVKQTSETQAVG